jgi:hypothetical protein
MTNKDETFEVYVLLKLMIESPNEKAAKKFAESILYGNMKNSDDGLKETDVEFICCKGD